MNGIDVALSFDQGIGNNRVVLTEAILAADSLVAKAAYCSTHSGLQRLFPG
jgi:hypothetical protein